MLSYRHSFHAGNFADVIKHVVLVEVLRYMTQKDKPFDYIDTHSGAGLFNLSSKDATKLNEYSTGIMKLDRNLCADMIGYFQCIDAFNNSGQISNYPGSPLIANEFLRVQDKAWLYELHPRDFELLCKNTVKKTHVKVFNSDGLKGY